MHEVREKPVGALHELIRKRLRHEPIHLHDDLLGRWQLVAVEQRPPILVLVR
jgi:hypothetical protein